MTVLMDKMFIKAGFDRRELERSTNRGRLYVGMIFMLGMAFAFSIMTILG